MYLLTLGCLDSFFLGYSAGLNGQKIPKSRNTVLKKWQEILDKFRLPKPSTILIYDQEERLCLKKNLMEFSKILSFVFSVEHLAEAMNLTETPEFFADRVYDIHDSLRYLEKHNGFFDFII